MTGNLNGENGEKNVDEVQERARISDLLRDVEPTFWICGTFDVRRRLLRRLTGAPLPRNIVLELLYTIDPPATVTIARGSARMECAVSIVVHPFADGSIFKLILLYDRAMRPPPDGVVARVREILEAKDFGSLASAPVDSVPIMRSRRPTQLAIFTVDDTFRVAGSWLSRDPAVSEMRAIVTPRGNTLPLFLETVLREITADWDWETGDRARPQVSIPIPMLIVRAIPLARGPEGDLPLLQMIVLLELLSVRYTLATAQRDFHLSDREVQVLQLVFEGRRVVEIAEALFLAESTIHDHIKHAIAKTGSTNRVEMTAKILGWAHGDDGSTP
ncbi:MAG TPA: helix-turn-helix transcriptional regulator [Candidatus Baltobacteraceae bacterium]|jgi:DNA-binding CsgD family transcriptional regulator